MSARLHRRVAACGSTMLALQLCLAALGCGSHDESDPNASRSSTSKAPVAPPPAVPAATSGSAAPNAPVAQAGRAGLPPPAAAGTSAMPGVMPPPTPGAPPAGAPPAGVPAAPEPPCSNCWKYLGHNPSSSFFNAAETKLTAANVASLKQVWMFGMPGSATGTAAVVNGTVYAPSMGAVVAFDAATGMMKWSARQNVPGSVSYDEGKLYVQNSAGLVVQLDAATGAVGWQAPVGSFGGFGTPLPVGNKVLCGASSGEENLVAMNAMFRGKAVALDKATGKLLWEYFTAMPPASGAAIWSSPSADLELKMAFITTGNNYTGVAGDQSDSIIALDLETGKLLWKYQATQNDVYTTVNAGPGPDHDFGTNPILFEANGKKLVGAGQKSGKFWALDRMTGQVVWSHQVAGGCGIGGVFNNGAYDGKRILVSSWPCAGMSTLKALDPTTGNPLWQKAMPAQSWAPITVANGVGFVASQQVLNAFDINNGNVLMTYMAGGSISSGAVVVDGRVFFGSGVPPLAGSFGGPVDDKVFHALALP